MRRPRAVAGPDARVRGGLPVTLPESADRLDLPLRKAVPELGRGAAALGRLGLHTPRQAIFHLPFRYDDFSELRPLGELRPDEKQSARVRVAGVAVEAGFGRRPQRVIAQLVDESGSAEAVWFGRRFVERRLRKGDEIIVSGKVTMRGWRPQFTSPDFSPAGSRSLHTARIVPVYPLTSGLTQRRVRELLARVLERCLPDLDDPLAPAERDGCPAWPMRCARRTFRPTRRMCCRPSTGSPSTSSWLCSW